MTFLSSAVFYEQPTPFTPLDIHALKWKADETRTRYLQAHGIQIQDKGDYFQLVFPEGTLAARKIDSTWGYITRMILPDGAIVDTIYTARQGVSIGVQVVTYKDAEDQV
jgi:hypothetical protein